MLDEEIVIKGKDEKTMMYRIIKDIVFHMKFEKHTVR